MVNLPCQYLERMQALLGAEFAKFQAIYSEPPQLGLRVNTLKISAQTFWQSAPFSLRPLEWISSGFIVEKSDSNQQVGKHPYHAAGLYYLQDPSAMAAVEVLSPQPGEKILDLSAAPGGKSTHIVSRLKNKGLLIANDIHPRRVWDLAENLERWGGRNVIITQETPQKLADHFGAYFDRVLVDAPCSGEGMFRKSSSARKDWSLSLVQACALRQWKLLQQASRLVKPGGFLAYTTCTFAPEENEGVIARFLQSLDQRAGPVFELIPVPLSRYFSNGRPEWIDFNPDLSLSGSTLSSLRYTMRLWPHQGHPEGHFIALFQRVDDGLPERLRPAVRQRVPSLVFKKFEEFCSQNLTFTPEDLHLDGSYLYQIPKDAPDLSGLRVIRPGWWLGSMKAGRFEPAHALALGLSSGEFARRVVLDVQSPLITHYLKGLSIEVPGEEGWLIVAIRFEQSNLEFPLGWGRRRQGMVKNYYPRGLRWV